VETILNKKNYSCFENTIYNLANLLGTKYQYIFMDSWSFYYNSKPNVPLDESLCDNRYLTNSLNDHQATLLSKYHGLSVEWISTDIANYISFIHSVRQNNNVLIVEMDTQHVGWYKLGKIYDVNHYFLILYIDELDDYYCLESYFSKSLQKLNFDDIIHIKRIGLVEKTPIKVILPNFNEVTKHAAIACNGESGTLSDFEMMKLFANDLTKNDKHKNIYKSDILNSATIARKLSYIVNGRHNICELLASLECSNKKYKSFIIESLNDIILNWQVINNLIIKWLYQNKISILHTVTNKILEVSLLEQKLSDDILSIT